MEVTINGQLVHFTVDDHGLHDLEGECYDDAS